MTLSEIEPVACPSLERDPRLSQKIICLCEIGLLIGASLAAGLWIQQQISPGLGETLGLIDGGAVDFLASSIAMLKQFSVQYGVLLIGVLGLAKLRGGRPASAFSLTKGDSKVTSLVGLGVVIGFVVSIPVQFMFVARELWSLGEGTALWMIADREPWDWTFWIFMGVGSFALIPLLEELTWRGYVLGRLSENFQPGAAIVVTTVFFCLLHLQYFVNPDPAKVLTIAGILFGAFVFGFVTLRTGSILPAIIAHVIINIPANLSFGIGKIAIGLLLTVIFRRQIAQWTRVALTWIINRDTVVAIALIVMLGGVVFVAVQWDHIEISIGLAFVASAALSMFSKADWRAG